MLNLYLDIETIPSQKAWVREYAESQVKPPAVMKKAETIQKWHDEEKEGAIEDFIRKMSFDGSANHIICIGYCIDGENIKTLFADKVDEEPLILETFFADICENIKGECFIVGHNVVNFDLKVIRQRCAILGIEVPEELSSSNDKHYTYDTMQKWDYKNHVSLERIAKAMRFGDKGDVDGSMIYDLYKQGKDDVIKEYNKNDVALVMKIHERMKQAGL